jgi:Uma2 family endonuclease
MFLRHILPHYAERADKMHVEHYYKTQPKQWVFCEYDGEEASLSLASFNFVISLAELYDKVEFE